MCMQICVCACVCVHVYANLCVCVCVCVQCSAVKEEQVLTKVWYLNAQHGLRYFATREKWAQPTCRVNPKGLLCALRGGNTECAHERKCAQGVKTKCAQLGCAAGLPQGLLRSLAVLWFKQM